MSPPYDAELDRIRREYARRREADGTRYAPHLPINRFARRSQQAALLGALEAAGAPTLRGRNLLDVGCGEGNWFGWFLDLGVDPGSTAGVDLDADRAAACSARHPEIDVRVANAAELPWPDASFDFVFQSTVLSSILDDGLRHAVAGEMRRVVRPAGKILSYDFFVRRPGNDQVRGIGRGELGRLFPGCRLRTRRTTLARPLAAVLAPRAWPLARLLEALAILNTHYFTVITPNP